MKLFLNLAGLGFFCSALEFILPRGALFSMEKTALALFEILCILEILGRVIRIQ